MNLSSPRIPKSAAIFLAATALASACAIVAQASPLSGSGAERVHTHGEPPGPIPKPGSVRFAAESRTARGEQRAVRAFETVDGRTCLQVGEREGSRLGRRVGARFEEQPVEAAGVCGGDGPFVAVTRDILEPAAGEGSEAVTAVYGVLPPGARDVTLRHASRSYDVTPTADGVYVLAFDGRMAGREPRVTWRDADGTPRALGGEAEISASGELRR